MHFLNAHMNQLKYKVVPKAFILDNKLGTEANAQTAPRPHAVLSSMLALDKC